MQNFLGGKIGGLKGLPQFVSCEVIFRRVLRGMDVDGVLEADGEMFLEIMERRRTEFDLFVSEVLLVPLIGNADLPALFPVRRLRYFRLLFFYDQKLIQVAIRVALFEVRNAVRAFAGPARKQVLGGLVLFLEENVDFAWMGHLPKIYYIDF